MISRLVPAIVLAACSVLAADDAAPAPLDQQLRGEDPAALSATPARSATQDAAPWSSTSRP